MLPAWDWPGFLIKASEDLFLSYIIIFIFILNNFIKIHLGKTQYICLHFQSANTFRKHLNKPTDNIRTINISSQFLFAFLEKHRMCWLSWWLPRKGFQAIQINSLAWKVSTVPTAQEDQLVASLLTTVRVCMFSCLLEWIANCNQKKICIYLKQLSLQHNAENTIQK